jgi:membrane-associated phospholipid phosphatase
MLLKLVFKRHRPPHHAADPRFIGPDQHSFPSGHATRVWGVVALLVALAESRPAVLEHVFHTTTGVVLAVAGVWALLINFTRVALGRHYPSDVVAGSVIGYFVFYPISALIVHSAGIL